MTWVVHLNKHSDNIKLNIDYLGKYLKRPPVGETRIKSYDGDSVSFEFMDHYTDTTKNLTLSALEFIARLISHIPDPHFRNIRYYGFLANRVRSKLLPKVYHFLGMKPSSKNNLYTPWRQMIQASFNFDPLKCPDCASIMILIDVSYYSFDSLTSIHKEIANGHYQLL